MWNIWPRYTLSIMFFHRVAREVALSLKTGKNIESMNNPVSKTRLMQMYEELRLEWPKVKKHLKSNNGNSESVRADIQVQLCLITDYCHICSLFSSHNLFMVCLSEKYKLMNLGSLYSWIQ